MGALPSFAVLRANGSALIFDCRGPRAPRILHWGADLADLDELQLTSLALSQQLARGHSAFDEPQPISFTRDSGEGFFGTPALMGHRAGTDFSNRFELVDADVSPSTANSFSVMQQQVSNLLLRLMCMNLVCSAFLMN